MTEAYLEFTELFRRLSPYELNHFSEVMLCKIENCFECRLLSERTQSALTEKEIKQALTQAMRDIAVQLRQKNINHQQIELTHAKANMFTSDPLAA